MLVVERSEVAEEDKEAEAAEEVEGGSPSARGDDAILLTEHHAIVLNKGAATVSRERQLSLKSSFD